jgi:cytochrome c-type biogenesis protein CcmE
MDLNTDVGGESADAGSMSDLTPRPVAPRRKRRWSAPMMLSIVVVAGGVVAFKGLKNATQYFCNADEVGVATGCTGDRAFRLQGVVQTGSLKRDGAVSEFVVEYNKAQIPARHEGDPPELFNEGIPVVLEGSMVNGRFESNLIMVKHSETYRAENPDRVPVNAP